MLRHRRRLSSSLDNPRGKHLVHVAVPGHLLFGSPEQEFVRPPQVTRIVLRIYARHDELDAADRVDLGEEGLDLVVLRIEVRRDANAGVGAMVAEEFAAVELAGDVGGAAVTTEPPRMSAWRGEASV